MKKFYLAALFELLFLSDVLCQNIDSSYVETYKQKVMISGTVSRNSFQLGEKNNEYLPNIPLNFGLGLLVRNTVINLRFGYGVVPLGKKENGKTKSIDFQIHKYGRRFLLDLSFQRYQGFYRQKPDIRLYPNLSVLQAGIEGIYVFNGKKFSAKAAFQQSEKQLKSVGSFLLGGNTYLHYINTGGDSSVVRQPNISNFQIGVSSGYAYSWVMNKHWLWATIITAGMNLGNEFEKLKEGKFKIYPAVYARSSLGYHQSDWGIAFVFLIHNNSVYYLENDSFNITSYNMQISYVKNIDCLFKKKSRHS